MNSLYAIFLGALQGITEFLPISSSGHLVIMEKLLGLKVEELKEFDIMLHFGTLFSILLYFRKDFIGLIKAFFGFFKDRKWTDEVKIILLLIIGTIPAVFVGVLLGDAIDNVFRSPVAVLSMMIFTACLFLVAEFVFKRYYAEKGDIIEDEGKIGVWKALGIGLMQALAIVPGISRSGSTIAMGLMLGVRRGVAARFSFLLGAIAILGAAVLTILDTDLAVFGQNVGFLALSLGFLSSFIFGSLSIKFLMKYLKNHTLIVFSVYLVFFASVFLILEL